jgi:hypothetical protein
MSRRLVIFRPDLDVPITHAGTPEEAAAAAAAAPEILREPTIAEMAVNFGGAMARWAAAGVPVVDQAGYDARTAACDACIHPDGQPMFDAKARFGLGKCRAPGCGCTSLKRWLATEVCALGRWPAWPLQG